MSNYGRVELHGYRFLILFLERPYSLATVFPGTPVFAFAFENVRLDWNVLTEPPGTSRDSLVDAASYLHV